ncbi:MAG: helix-turn-helix domain-containing protein [Homoserinimonas sp.]|nr:helix-turn-helix domain-containing protein [Homoserinimonas sp.]
MTGRQRSSFKTLSSLSRINLLRELQVHGPMTIGELSKATSLHHNTAREHMHRLIDAGFVSFEKVYKNAKGRPQIRYRTATDPRDPSSGARVRAAEDRTRKLNQFVDPGCCSDPKTPTQKQLDLLDDHLDQTGFDAEIKMDAGKVAVHNCPFGDLARDNPQVCEVHFTLVKETLQLGQGPVRATELHRFETPSDCSIDLSTDSPVGKAERAQEYVKQ